MPKFGKKSSRIKATIHPYLALLCDNVVKYFDIALVNGLREKEEQNSLFEKKLSKLKWPLSKHNALPENKFPDNLSKAVDVTPFPIPEKWGLLPGLNADKAPITNEDLERINFAWKERVKFYQMAAVFKFVWSMLQESNPALKSFRLRFGIDWDGDSDFRDQEFDDLLHIELEEV